MHIFATNNLIPDYCKTFAALINGTIILRTLKMTNCIIRVLFRALKTPPDNCLTGFSVLYQYLKIASFSDHTHYASL